MHVAAIIPALAAGTLALDRPFAGRPLLAQTIAQARSCAAISRIAVVTDDAVAARIAEGAGAQVIMASTNPGFDGGRSWPGDRAAALAAEAFGAAADLADAGPDLFVILDPARPVRTPEMIEAALSDLTRCGGDSLISVHASEQTLWREDAGGFGRLVADDGSSRAGSARENGSLWAENRALVVTRATRLREWGHALGGRIVLHRIPHACALALHEEDNWVLAEAAYRRLWTGRQVTRLADIRLLVFDFDGVMTDNRVVVFEDGREGVLCSRGDGMGMDLLRASGLPVAVISKEGNPVVSARCRKLKIPCIQGIGDKLPVLSTMVADQGIELESVAYMGNDINDLECMEAVGLAIAPADAEDRILRIAHLVTVAPGGYGAVREVADLFVAARAGASAA